MWKALTAVVVLCFLGLGLGFASLLWPQHDYAGENICTPAEIERTYATLDRSGWFGDASQWRVTWESMNLRTPEESIRRAIERVANAAVDNAISRRRTAAFTCNHATTRFGDGPALKSMPVIAAALAPFASSSDDVWKMAMMAGMKGTFRPQLSRELVQRISFAASHPRQYGRRPTR